MGKKTDLVKNKLQAIKTKFDYARCAGSTFENKVRDDLENKIKDKYKQCAEAHHWSPDNLRFNGSATNNTITVRISAPVQKPDATPPPDLMKSVIDEAKNALKSAAKTNNTAISEYNWTDLTVTCSPEREKSILTITIIGNAKTPKTSK